MKIGTKLYFKGRDGIEWKGVICERTVPIVHPGTWRVEWTSQSGASAVNYNFTEDMMERWRKEGNEIRIDESYIIVQILEAYD